jgi:PAS domain S-box-containing protein
MILWMVLATYRLEQVRLESASRELREIERRYATTFQSIPTGIGIADQETGRFLAANLGFTQLFGYTEPEIIGRCSGDLGIWAKPEQRDDVIHRLERGEEVRHLPLRIRRKDGSLRWVSYSGDRVVLDGRPCLLSTAVDITEQRATAEALLESEKRYRTVFEQAGDYVLINELSPDGPPVIVDLNEAALEVHGYTREELVGQPITLIDPFVNPVENQQRIETLRMGNKAMFEVRHRRKDGSTFDVEVRATPLRIGERNLILAVERDITERNLAEKALRESEERWKFAIEGAGDGLWDWNVQTGVAYFSPRYKEMLGYTDAEIGTTSDEWSKRIHPEDASVVFAALQPYMDGRPGNATVEFRMLCKDGSWRWIQGRGMVVSRDPDGKPIRMIGINTDITERKETKDALLAQSTALSAVIDNNPMSIQILDNDGRTIRTNPAFLTLFGAMPPPDYCMFSDPTLASQGLSPLFDRIRAGEVVYFPEVPYNVHDLFPEFPDSPVWVRALGFPIIGKDGRPERFVLMHEDISQRRHEEQVKAVLQAQLQQSQKMESLGTLAGGVAHDMNNVLGAILGLASAHIGTQPFGSPLHQVLDTICKATERGGKMVRSLLSFARQSPAENNKLNMNAIIKEQVALLERTTLAKVRLEIDLEENLRPILGDASTLTHAFMNLCVNAVDAMPENGTLTLHTRNVDNDWIEVVVEDNGTGMPKEVLDKAMEPFFTTKGIGKGTGLGLSMVFSTVKAHRGQMAIESEPDKGTRVMMRFPACEQEAQVQAAATAVTEPTLIPHGTMKVLLIDDDDLIRSSVQAILEVLGHTSVNTAQSGEEALALLEAGFEPDLVILDMNMPGLGGIGTLPRLRMLRPDVPVLLATGRVDQTALTLASVHRGVTLLSKPFGLRELQKHLESVGLG